MGFIRIYVYDLRMPFTPYKSEFGPKTLEVLQEAFDMAWSEVGHAQRATLDQETARNTIARRIVDAWHLHEERDPERLKAYAVQGLTD